MKILAKAYIQLGQFSKTNDSKTVSLYDIIIYHVNE